MHALVAGSPQPPVHPHGSPGQLASSSNQLHPCPSKLPSHWAAQPPPCTPEACNVHDGAAGSNVHWAGHGGVWRSNCVQQTSSKISSKSQSVTLDEPSSSTKPANKFPREQTAAISGKQTSKFWEQQSRDEAKVLPIAKESGKTTTSEEKLEPGAKVWAAPNDRKCAPTKPCWYGGILDFRYSPRFSNESMWNLKKKIKLSDIAAF